MRMLITLVVTESAVSVRVSCLNSVTGKIVWHFADKTRATKIGATSLFLRFRIPLLKGTNGTMLLIGGIFLSV